MWSRGLVKSQDEIDKAFGESLKALRVSLGMTQEVLAAQADVDQSKLSSVERLGPGEVSWVRLCRIADALGAVVEVNLRSDRPDRPPRKS